MASREPAEAFGEALVDLLKVVFSLIFPLLFLALCGASYLLAFEFRLPEFGFWAVLGLWLLDWGESNIWAAIGLGAFAFSVMPLTWLALREQELRVSNTLLAYVIGGLVVAFLTWLRMVWPYDGAFWQLAVYGLAMFCGGHALVDAFVGTLGIVLHIRRNRPRPVAPPRQQPHAAPREEQRGARDEPETI
jgi:hypothetical protein